jgi:hypothetical protein
MPNHSPDIYVTGINPWAYFDLEKLAEGGHLVPKEKPQEAEKDEPTALPPGV